MLSHWPVSSILSCPHYCVTVDMLSLSWSSLQCHCYVIQLHCNWAIGLIDQWECRQVVDIPSKGLLGLLTGWESIQVVGLNELLSLLTCCEGVKAMCSSIKGAVGPLNRLGGHTCGCMEWTTPYWPTVSFQLYYNVLVTMWLWCPPHPVLNVMLGWLMGEGIDTGPICISMAALLSIAVVTC